MNGNIVAKRMQSLIRPTGEKCLKACKAFHDDKARTFELIYSPEVLSRPDILLVLDSSFNPPHMGHHTLIKKGLEYYRGKSTQVLLLLSVNNADKAPKPASFDKRMQMMCLMADTLRSDNVAVSVGITKFAKYVDKYEVLSKHYNYTSCISFLVGFDTIIRIFDPKYYYPQLPAEALKDFMAHTEFCCLTREGGNTFGKQVDYADDISNGVYEPTLPREWGNRIHMMVNDKRYENVSSSNIREEILAGKSAASLGPLLPTSIIQYISNSKDPIF